MLRNTCILFFVAVILLNLACSRKVDTSLSTILTAPIIKSTITVNNLVDGDNLETDTNGLVHLKIQENIFDFNLTELIEFPEEGIDKSFTVDSLTLADNNIVYPITLGDIARGIGGLGGAFLLAAHGAEAAIPAISDLSAGEVDINANDLFHEAILEKGLMVVAINNELPINVENLGYTFRNKGNQNIVASGLFASIPPNTFAVDSFDLEGKTIQGDLEVILTDFSSSGTDGDSVVIDTADALTINLEVSGLEVYQATAIFPTQNLVNDHNDMALENLGASLIEAGAASGTFMVDMFSTAEDTIYFEYNFPGMMRDGTTFNNLIKLQPGSAANPSTKQVSFDLTGYVFDLTGLRNDTVNHIGSTFRVYIDSSGKVITLSKSDSFNIIYNFENIRPSYVIGNIHDTVFNVGPAISHFSAFDNIRGGLLSFSSSTTQINITNGLGVKAELKIDTLLARKNQSSVLLNSGKIEDNIVIDAAAYNDSVDASVTTIILNNSNSNFIDMLNLLPDLFFYSADVFLNPGEDASFNHFAYENSDVSIDLDIDIPLNVKAKNLRFADTVEINLNENIDISSVKEILIKYQNTFPFEMDPKFIFLDSTYAPQDSIELDGTIKNNKLVNEINTPISSKKTALFKTSKYISIVTEINAISSNDRFVSIEQDQFLTIQLLFDTEIELIK